MPEIALLTQETIDKIAAGEVIERPASVVKELVENAIDAGSSAVTVEIKDGGTSFIRITDNGCGISKNQVSLAFLRHSTSKIRNASDLMKVHSLGFRGEALSSISAVSRVEMFTKVSEDMLGTHYVIEGSKEMLLEETGAPDGTTFLVKDLFYNTPARRKFLKSPQTEGSHISDMLEKLALSNPGVSIKYIQNNVTKLHTSGNGNVKDVIYHIFGRDITSNVLPVSFECAHFKLSGFIGKPVVTRGNRNYENYYINGRYVKSGLLSKAIEEAYKPYIMQHQYPFTVLYLDFPAESLDVNVHPTKMDLRFDDSQKIYVALCNAISSVLAGKEMIQEVSLDKHKEKTEAVSSNKDSIVNSVKKENEISAVFTSQKMNDIRQAIKKDTPYEIQYPKYRPEEKKAGVREATSFDHHNEFNPKVKELEEKKRQVTVPVLSAFKDLDKPAPPEFEMNSVEVVIKENKAESKIQELKLESKPESKSENQTENKPERMPDNMSEEKPNQNPKAREATRKEENYKELTLADLDPVFLSEEAKANHRIIGQVFQTFWMVELGDKLYIIDQHAAHEKVLYERFMKRLEKRDFTSQQLNPPIVLTLDHYEAEALEKYRSQIETFGYEVNHFGGKEYMISAIPDNLFHMDMKELFIEMLDDFSNETGKNKPELILEKVASMSCKAAVKGNNKLSLAEVTELIDELLTLDNPYNCPHGRPTIISMTKYELEKKFKRII